MRNLAVASWACRSAPLSRARNAAARSSERRFRRKCCSVAPQGEEEHYGRPKPKTFKSIQKTDCDQAPWPNSVLVTRLFQLSAQRGLRRAHGFVQTNSIHSGHKRDSQFGALALRMDSDRSRRYPPLRDLLRHIRG